MICKKCKKEINIYEYDARPARSNPLRIYKCECCDVGYTITTNNASEFCIKANNNILPVVNKR